MDYRKELKSAFELLLNTQRIDILEKWTSELVVSECTFEVGGRIAIKIFPTNIGFEITAIDAGTGNVLDLSLLPGEDW